MVRRLAARLRGHEGKSRRSSSRASTRDAATSAADLLSNLSAWMSRAPGRIPQGAFQVPSGLGVSGAQYRQHHCQQPSRRSRSQKILGSGSALWMDSTTFGGDHVQQHIEPKFLVCEAFLHSLEPILRGLRIYLLGLPLQQRIGRAHPQPSRCRLLV